MAASTSSSVPPEVQVAVAIRAGSASTSSSVPPEIPVVVSNIAGSASTSSSLSPEAPVVDPDRPFRLVYRDERGKFQIDPQAATVLQLLNGPVGIVSVCGLARQGKSFILNQLCERDSGFEVGSTHQCTKGLWLWSPPLKRTDLDGREFNILLLDSEGINAQDQTGAYGNQIFSLAVLLSSMFIFNQMGSIDGAALDRLSLVTQMMSYIHIRASKGKTTVSELGKLSPIFVWLLRDFSVDLGEDNRRTPARDYMEDALRKTQGGGDEIAGRNKIRDSIQTFFRDRECFRLVRPTNNVNNLQLGQLSSEFVTQLNELKNFVVERTRPKEFGETVMTGPMLIHLTKYYLDAINNGPVPTVSTSWQSDEEAWCIRAMFSATMVYEHSFDSSKLPEEVVLWEAHGEAVWKSLAAFNSETVGVTRHVRCEYKQQLQEVLMKKFEDYKRNAYEMADLQCSGEIKKMEERLKATCNASGASADNIVYILDALLSDYNASCHGPRKWQKLMVFLEESLEDPLIGFMKKLIQFERGGSEVILKFYNWLISTEKNLNSEVLKSLDDVSEEKEKSNRESIEYLQKKGVFDAEISSLSKDLDSIKEESSDWKTKYEAVLADQKADNDRASSEIAVLKSQISGVGERLASETKAWEEKYNKAVKDVDDLKSDSHAKLRGVAERIKVQLEETETTWKGKFTTDFSAKESQMMSKEAELEYFKGLSETAEADVKKAVSEGKTSDANLLSGMRKIRELKEKIGTVNGKVTTLERGVAKLEKLRNSLQHCEADSKRLEETYEKAERDTQRAIELACAERRTAWKLKASILSFLEENKDKVDSAGREVSLTRGIVDDMLKTLTSTQGDETQGDVQVMTTSSRKRPRVHISLEDGGSRQEN